MRITTGDSASDKPPAVVVDKNVAVGVYLTVFSSADLSNDLADLLECSDHPDVRCVRVSSGSPRQGRTWETYDLTSPSQTSPLSIEVQHGRGLGEGLAGDVRELPSGAIRDEVISRLAETVATVEFKLSLVDDWDLFFRSVETVTATGRGLVFCEGDPAGFYDDVRGQPFLALR